VSVPEFMLGVETEYALSGDNGLDDALRRLVDLAGKKLNHLTGGAAHDLFLENGARFYVDCGGHPEMCTPECSNPADIVRYIAAGERILADLIDDISLGKAGAAMLFKGNVNYSGSRTTWGSHESYLYRAHPELFPDHIIPHLVSRVIYTGAGGFNPLSAGLEFTLSPRSWHINKTQSCESTHDRGIFHTKNESLSRTGTHRLHLLCGESLCSHLATWLRVGTTAIVTGLIDAGVRPGTAVPLSSPVSALRKIVADPTCKAWVSLSSGRRLHAIDIQRHYLQEAERNLDILPRWAADVCEQWRRVLDGLESDPGSLSTTLDWAIKYPIYRRRIAQSGIEWDDIPCWNHVAERIRGGIRGSSHRGIHRVELILGRTKAKSPIPDTIDDLTPYVKSHGLDWDMLRPFVDLRKELFELDMRFGQLGECGIFNRLDQAGLLQHKAPGVENIDAAKTDPPETGRARIRGESIRAHARQAGLRCYWDSIWDATGRRLLDMSDPFRSDVEWRGLARDEQSTRMGGSTRRRRPRRPPPLPLFDD
jgi:hypothetical protein